MNRMFSSRERNTTVLWRLQLAGLGCGARSDCSVYGQYLSTPHVCRDTPQALLVVVRLRRSQNHKPRRVSEGNAQHPPTTYNTASWPGGGVPGYTYLESGPTAE
eukprot:COSAG02_NODE_4251_length_5585_cov_4.672986_2_plen_104_part_00